MKGLSKEKRMEIIGDGSILAGYRGSVAHGTYTPKYGITEMDDKDVISVCIPGPEYYIGLKGYNTEQREVLGDDGCCWDFVIYELKHFIRLLMKANPNVLSLLWLPEHLYIKRTKYGDMLVENRNLFATKRAYHSFIGYAKGQLHRMTHVNTSDLGAKRKALVDRFGYDTKNASHLVRILRTGLEFLTDGEIHVVREDAQELIDIKNGEYPLKRIIEESEKLFELSREAYVRTELPNYPDVGKIEAVLMEILGEYLCL